MTTPSVPVSKDGSGIDSDLAVLMMDELRLLLPQRAIRTLEPALDVESGREGATVVGFLTFEERPWPVHCLSKDLLPVHSVPQTRRVCVLLNADQGYFCLLCDRVLLLKRRKTKLTPLPTCMGAKASPFLYLALLEEGIGCLSSVDQLIAYVRGLSTDESAVQRQQDRVDVGQVRGLA